MDTYISYLPAAHSFEQCLFATSMIYGVRCGFFGGDVLKMISNDIPTLKPTFFPSVPRLYNRIYGKIKDKVKETTGCKGWLLHRAIETKLANLKSNGSLTHSCYDALVFNKMKALLGGNVRLMLTASAPLAADVMDFLKICFSCDLREGYGMTETCGGSFATFEGENTSGHVGGPLANVKIRLRDIPEMGYLHTNNPPKGEVCFWGPANMEGYFKNPEKTKESRSDDGWIYSGDVGMINKNMSLSIVDRAKNIFKLSQGEYIAPEKLENVYVQSPYLMQVYVHGDSLHDHCVMFGVIEPEHAKKYAKDHGVTLQSLVSDMNFRNVVYLDMMALAKESKFNSLERPKQMRLLLEPFTIEDGMLTPTMKLKRNVAKERLAKEIAQMYKDPVIDVRAIQKK
jgi:long-chain acyl-CoA synthetase